VGERNQVLTGQILISDLLVRLLGAKISKLAKIMNAETPRELASAVAGLFPLTPEIKIVSITGPPRLSVVWLEVTSRASLLK
jgi:hypothetical protein